MQVRSILFAAALVGAVSCRPATTQPRAAGPDLPKAEIERLYVEGQDMYTKGDFASAADTWTYLLEHLSETQANRATREMVLLGLLQAEIDAYNGARLNDGAKDVERLRSGKKALEQYGGQFRRAYGALAAVSAAVKEKGDEITALLKRAESGA